MSWPNVASVAVLMGSMDITKYAQCHVEHNSVDSRVSNCVEFCSPIEHKAACAQKCRVRDHQCGCRGGNRYEKGNPRIFDKKGN